MTKEQIEKLTKYYPSLKSARYNRCIILAQVHFIHILEIVYGSEWKSHVSSQVMSCGKCKLDELSKICDMYESSIKTFDTDENAIKESSKQSKKTTKNVKRNSKKTSA